MTFDDDFVELHSTSAGMLRLTCKGLGLDWPPPEELTVPWHAKSFKRVRHSEITDTQRATMFHVCRGAVYVEVE